MSSHPFDNRLYVSSNRPSSARPSVSLKFRPMPLNKIDTNPFLNSGLTSQSANDGLAVWLLAKIFPGICVGPLKIGANVIGSENKGAIVGTVSTVVLNSTTVCAVAPPFFCCWDAVTPPVIDPATAATVPTTTPICTPVLAPAMAPIRPAAAATPAAPAAPAPTAAHAFDAAWAAMAFVALHRVA